MSLQERLDAFTADVIQKGLRKIATFLEEAGVPYRISQVNLGKNEQSAEDFLGVSPNNEIPAIPVSLAQEIGPNIEAGSGGIVTNCCRRQPTAPSFARCMS